MNPKQNLEPHELGRRCSWSGPLDWEPCHPVSTEGGGKRQEGGRWLGPRDLCPGHVLEPGVRPGPCSLLATPLDPARRLPCSQEANSVPSLESPYLVSWVSFCPRLARHTLEKEVDISFHSGIGEPQAPPTLPPIPNPDPPPSSALACGRQIAEGPAMASQT